MTTLLAAAGVVAVGPTPARASAGPSGARMPGSFPTWRQTFADDFTGTQLNGSNWTTYDGPSKSYATSVWSPSDVSVANGVLNLLTQWDGTSATAGAVASAVEGGQSYGKWAVRMRMPNAPGVNVTVALYPEGGGWPPEIDFAENGGGTRDHILSTLHYAPDNTQIHETLTGVDFSSWHTVGVILTPGHLQYTLDGRAWASITTSHVPAQKMWLTIQTGITNCTPHASSCATAGTPEVVDTQVDWVVRYTAR